MARLESFIYNHKVGYKNSDGKIIIQPQFDEGPDSFGSDCGHKYGSVALNGKCGIINEDGEIVVSLEYEEAVHLMDDLFALRKFEEDGSWDIGVVDSKGKDIIPFEYKAIYEMKGFIQCYKKASSERRWSSRILISGYNYSATEEPHLFNTKGLLIFEGEIVDSQLGLLITSIDNKLGLMDEFGNIIIDNKYDEIHCVPQMRLLITSIDNKLGLINEFGNIIIDNKYDEIHCVSPNRFVVRLNEGNDDWRFGVVDENDFPIIPFDYKLIEHSYYHFFECFPKCDCENQSIPSFNHRYSYTARTSPHWHNSDGKQIYSGFARPLNEYLLSVEREGKWGVYSYDGKKIVNFSYDSITSVCGKIVVGINGKVGILDRDGRIVINPSYKKIECVCMSANVYDNNEQIEESHEKDTYEKYSTKNVFSSNDCGTHLKRKTIFAVPETGLWFDTLRISHAKEFDFEKTFILNGDDFSELFSISDGIIPNSQFDKISQLTDISYAVKAGEHWGVFRSDAKKLIIPCEYDQIVFDGGHVVYLQKDGLWGAKTLVLPSFPRYDLLKVDIPVSFLEIKALDPSQSLYGVKLIRKDYNDNNNEEYTIVDTSGHICVEYLRAASQFTLYRPDRILCSDQYGKYGFLSLYGYDSIPFIYDEIKERKGNKFDARIGNKWGVLSLDKGEEVAIKYAQPIPIECENYDGIVVTDALTDREGLLSETGNERIPTIYDHIVPEDNFTFFLCRLFDGKSRWGCLDKNGIIIIPPKYNCLNVDGDYFLAGNSKFKDAIYKYDIVYDFHNEFHPIHDRKYDDLKYDLYDKFGNRIIGGFNLFIEECNIYMFSFFDIQTEWASWIVTTKDLTSIKRTKDGNKYQFKKGNIVDISIKNEGGKTTYYWNCPIEILIKGVPHVSGDYILIRTPIRENESYAIRICDGQETEKYGAIDHIKLNYFSVRKEGKVGLIDFDGNIIIPIEYDEIKYFNFNHVFVQKGEKVGLIDFNGNIIIPIEYTGFTSPMNSYFFGIIEGRENGNHNVELFDIQNEKIQSYRAITNRDITSDEEWRWLRININVFEEGLKSISVPVRDIFDEDFKNRISNRECNMGEPNLFSGPKWPPITIDNCDRDFQWDSWDAWDAMTDGMYGDMPDDGFNGDYDFLGR